MVEAVRWMSDHNGNLHGSTEHEWEAPGGAAFTTRQVLWAIADAEYEVRFCGVCATEDPTLNGLRFIAAQTNGRELARRLANAGREPNVDMWVEA